MDMLAPLASRAIKSLVISVDTKYVSAVERYALSLGCTLLFRDNTFTLYFPDGTMEETWGGRSTQWTETRTIRLPSGEEITKLTLHALDGSREAVTTISIPNVFFDGEVKE